MNYRDVLTAVTIAGALMHAPSASAAVIDYNAAPTAGFFTPWTEDGFETTSTGGVYINALYEVSTDAGGVISITRVGGGAFSLSSIDFRLFEIDQLFPAAFSFTVTGDKVGGGTATQLVSGLTTSMQTITFGADFGSLLAVRFTQGPSVAPFDDLVFDNVNVTEVSAATVPEPASLVLLALGMARLGALRRRLA